MKAELVKYIFKYHLVPAVGARMIGDQEWSEYVYEGDVPEIEVYKVEATDADINHLFAKEVKLPNFDLEDYCGFGLGGIKDYLELKLKNSYNTDSVVEFEVYTITKGDCVVELLNKHDEVYVEDRLKEELEND